MRLELQRPVTQTGWPLSLQIHMPCRNDETIRPARAARGCPWLDALWQENLVWHDIREFVENPGEVLERVKEQREERRTQTGELKERIASLTKRLATVQGEKDKYVKLYAAGHLDEGELE